MGVLSIPAIQHPTLISHQITQHGIRFGGLSMGQALKQPVHLYQYKAAMICTVLASMQFGRTAMCTDVDRTQILVPANTRKRGRW